MAIAYVTPNVGVPNPALGQSPLANAVDIYRNPLPLSDGNLLAVHSAVKQYDSNTGADAQHPLSRYDFKMRMLITSGANLVPDFSTTLVTEPNVSLSYYANGTLVTYSGAPLWELDPVEVVAPGSKPAQLGTSIAGVEQTVFDEEGVHAPTMQNYLRTHNLAMVINRDSTRRDAADKQQPYNLKVSWSGTQTVGAGGKIYDIGWLQILQADAIRAFTLSSNANALPQPGRRRLPVPLHDSVAEMPVVQGAPTGAVKLGTDGSWAAIVPAGRAVTWHLMDGTGTKSQIKERYWVTFAPGEIRTCAVCHGVNTRDQAGNLGVPTNKPEALRGLLQFWKGNHPPGVVQHANGAATALKNCGVATLTVTRTAGSTGPVTVNYATSNGTAIANVDYTPTSGILSWADGDTAPKTISIPVLNNPTVAGSKTLAVALSNPLYASLGATPSATLTLAETALDAWRYATFGANANTPGIGLPTDDADGDGQNNQSEFAAGTSPLDATSVFALKTSLVGGQVHLTFTAQPGIGYTVQYKDALSDPTWHHLVDINPLGSAQLEDIIDPSGAAQRFYRVATPQQP
jgi:hypothetical protein